MGLSVLYCELLSGWLSCSHLHEQHKGDNLSSPAGIPPSLTATTPSFTEGCYGRGRGSWLGWRPDAGCPFADVTPILAKGPHRVEAALPSFQPTDRVQVLGAPIVIGVLHPAGRPVEEIISGSDRGFPGQQRRTVGLKGCLDIAVRTRLPATPSPPSSPPARCPRRLRR